MIIRFYNLRLNIYSDCTNLENIKMIIIFVRVSNLKRRMYGKENFKEKC